jgi:hypothetical protein
MKKTDNINPKDYDDGMLPEYDFTGKKGVRGKYYRSMQNGYTVRIRHEDGTVTVQRFGPTITLDSDVSAFFPDSESVNKALRALIAIIPIKQVGEQKAKYTARKKPDKSLAARK